MCHGGILPLDPAVKRQYALQAKADNEKAFKKYMLLVTQGKPEYEARDIVKDAFSIGDRRLDRLLDTRAGLMSPGTIAEIEAKVFIYVDRIDRDVKALRRHADDQLERLEVTKAEGVEWFDVKLVEEAGGKNGTSIKTERVPMVEAEKRLLEAKLKYNQQLFDALKAIKADTVVKFGDRDISQYSDEDLEKMLKVGRARHDHEVAAEFTVEDK